MSKEKYKALRKIKIRSLEYTDEEREWLRLSPSQRILETTKLWKLYLALGGRLEPEPDPQSPFYFKEISG